MSAPLSDGERKLLDDVVTHVLGNQVLPSELFVTQSLALQTIVHQMVVHSGWPNVKAVLEDVIRTLDRVSEKGEALHDAFNATIELKRDLQKLATFRKGRHD